MPFGVSGIHKIMEILTRLFPRKPLPGPLKPLRLFFFPFFAIFLGIPAVNLPAQETPVDSTEITVSTPVEPQSAPTSPAQKNDASPSTQQTPDQAQRDPQTKRILGIIPNFRAVSTDEKLPPQSVKDKFMDATQDSFDYSSAFIPLMLAGYSMSTNATPEFGKGGPGFARYLWHSAVDQTSENYMVEFIVPTLTHEDTRYYTLFRGGFLKRTGYALSRAVITRNDAGKNVFNMSEVVGAGAAAGISNLYYPSKSRSFANTGTQWGLDVGIDGASFFVKEFWPDINHKLFHAAKPADAVQK